LPFFLFAPPLTVAGVREGLWTEMAGDEGVDEAAGVPEMGEAELDEDDSSRSMKDAVEDSRSLEGIFD
jgi:hypothetical protein